MDSPPIRKTAAAVLEPPVIPAPTQNIAALPTLARRERLMRRRRILTLETGASTSLEDENAPPLSAYSLDAAPRFPPPSATWSTPPRSPLNRIRLSTDLRPQQDSTDESVFTIPSGTPPPQPQRLTVTTADKSIVGRKLASVGFGPNLLMPPSPQQLGLTKGEAPPHRKDTVERIPIRARSQSWLIRTRHLLDEDKVLSQILHILSVILVVLTFPFCIPFCVRVCKEYERSVVFRLGRLIKRGTKGPGVYFIMPCIDTYKVVDLRVLSFDVPPQEILSRDSVTVSVEAVIYFRISNPVISVTNVNDAQFSTKLLAQTTLRNVLGTKTLSEILMERDNISNITEKVLDDGTDPWGVKVQRVEIKDIRLPHQLMRSMAAEAEAARDARARVIAADGERNASRSLVQAADVIRQNKVSLHLRYLQTMAHISAEHNQTIVIPLPMDLVRGIMNRIKKWRKSKG
ncbi:SPFH domain / band 7 family domain-containing protein [Ditylenchus destructor]|uniref:SPFH domain / band 7 family domain-containing protein n=1 Tax=Ditylenchus destructor TaxID=166010 RepID=A0AAD4N410_9BILA|nr:SPFH domain / band 7 family domain-containing protein [Ditylenchus destructor]